jgi:hypothetical protein
MTGNRAIASAVISILFILPLCLSPAEAKAEEWRGALADGSAVSEDDIHDVLAEHRSWLKTDKKEGRRAVFKGASLIGIFLFERDLSGADLEYADLSKANLQRANLTGANLRGVNLSEANLQEARFATSDMRSVSYEPLVGTSPHLLSIATARNLQWLTYHSSPHGLIELREAFKKAGLRDQERMITFAIEHAKRVKMTGADPFSFLFAKPKGEKTQENGRLSFWGRLGTEITGWIYYVFVELTCEYGMSPWRSLFLLVALIPFFAVPYFLFLYRGQKDGIWKVWNKERMRKDLGETEPARPLRLRGATALWVGFYFSLLSAFAIGWRELNVGSWIARLQKHEYNYQATGWAKTFSGFQSLLSVYFLALWALTYFGRPFD